MIISILIIAFSLVLMGYWFRYSCILLLRNAQEEAVATPADDVRFAFPQVQLQLESSGELGALHRSLDRDFQLLKYLVEHAAGLRFESIDDRLLMLDFTAMRLWYGFTRVAAPEQARRALVEMAAVLGVLVRHMNEHAGVRAEA